MVSCRLRLDDEATCIAVALCLGLNLGALTLAIVEYWSMLAASMASSANRLRCG